MAVDIVVVVSCQHELFHVVGTLHSLCCRASRLHGGQEKRDQDTDNRDDNEKFDESEGAGKSTTAYPPPSSILTFFYNACS